jgi:hypothetical protein
MKIHCLFLCIVGPLLSSCTSSNASSTDSNPFVNIPHEVVAEGLELGIKNQQLHVITNDAQLASFAAMATFPSGIPAVNLDASDVVAIIADSTGCNGIRLNNVSESADTLLVEIDKTVPGPNLGCAAVVPDFRPYILVTVPKRGKPVSFTFAVKIV